jgi:hypothetical protein
LERHLSLHPRRSLDGALKTMELEELIPIMITPPFTKSIVTRIILMQMTDHHIIRGADLQVMPYPKEVIIVFTGLEPDIPPMRTEKPR